MCCRACCNEIYPVAFPHHRRKLNINAQIYEIGAIRACCFCGRSAAKMGRGSRTYLAPITAEEIDTD